MNGISNIELDMIADDVKKGSSPQKLHRKYGYNLEVCNRIIHTLTGKPYTEKETDNHQFGRKDLREFIVSVTRASEPWPVRDAEKIQKARFDYEAGTHEMFQGRDGDHIILYSQPRRRPTSRRKWFTRLEVN